MLARPLRRVPRPLRLLAGVLAAWVLVHVLVITADGVTDDPVSVRGRPADLVVVLGTKVHPDGKLSDRLRARLDRALALYRDGQAPMLMTSGGRGREGPEEADVMRAYLISQGVPADRVIADRTGVDTMASARATAGVARRLGARRVLVVSQFFHLTRAKLAFRRAGVEAGAVHAGFYEPRDLWGVAREVPAYYTYLLRR
jgi:vancomycin permeability regulator SanA